MDHSILCCDITRFLSLYAVQIESPNQLSLYPLSVLQHENGRRSSRRYSRWRSDSSFRSYCDSSFFRGLLHGCSIGDNVSVFVRIYLTRLIINQNIIIIKIMHRNRRKFPEYLATPCFDFVRTTGRRAIYLIALIRCNSVSNTFWHFDWRGFW